MITASHWYENAAGRPEGDPGAKAVGITLEDDAAGWRHEEIVAIQAGDAAHEQAQLDHAVEKLITMCGKTGSWKWT